MNVLYYLVNPELVIYIYHHHHQNLSVNLGLPLDVASIFERFLSRDSEEETREWRRVWCSAKNFLAPMLALKFCNPVFIDAHVEANPADGPIGKPSDCFSALLKQRYWSWWCIIFFWHGWLPALPPSNHWILACYVFKACSKSMTLFF